MPISLERLRAPLQNFDFKTLFVRGLTWNAAKSTIPPIEADEKTYTFTPIAEQGGMMIAECVVSADDSHGLLPPVTTRRKLSQKFSEYHLEHILIFTDRARQAAVWLWPKREDGKVKTREHTYRRGQPGDLLIGKLAGIAFTLDELDDAGRASIAEVGERVTRAFDVERITRRFYDTFKVEHDSFQAFLTGVKDAAHQAWYTSVMLNRLMFLYFVQKKSFLDGNTDYLRAKLAESQRNGSDRFYRDFLIVLFFEGLACEPRERSTATNKLLGSVPYLNGGIFMPHQIEDANPGIELPDAAFERLFAFFDRYQWHLDDRPLRADNEINPDVLGYIFEKYINQKQMGAYYTKEDITDYICKYTILPFLLDKIGLNVAQELTSIDPIIYEAVKTDAYLPTETEREYAARQKRYEQIGLDFAAGKIATVNDLITYNLDIRAFGGDWLARLDAPTMLRRFYAALTELTVLDPTCGSGAFLFAAMNILEPLYEGCLRKMEEFTARPDGAAFTDFRTELDRVRAHPNERYFIFKSIIVNNLYGVDIMDEAVEICKLRLFLKLVAQVNDVRRIEPLPDIDFNIRAGNTLVGFATEAEIQADLFAQAVLPQIKTMAGTLATFRDQQLQTGVAPTTLKTLKTNVRRVQGEIADNLDKALMDQYGQTNLAAFRASHKPFHWYAEYNGVMASGGFDVIVGNPPYVEYSKVRKEYTIRGYKTESCGNLWAFACERVAILAANIGRVGLIVPLSIVSTERMESLQKQLLRQDVWFSHFDVYPTKLFEGAKQRLTIFVTSPYEGEPRQWATIYNRWKSEARPHLLSSLEFSQTSHIPGLSVFPKTGTLSNSNILAKIRRNAPIKYANSGAEPSFFVHRIPYNYVKAFDFVPYFWNEMDGHKKSEDYKPYYLTTPNDKAIVLAILNSNLFFWWWYTLFEGYHCGRHEIQSFPVGLERMDKDARLDLGRLSSRLMVDLRQNSQRRKAVYKNTGAVEYDEFYPRLSKFITNEIDSVLARHYGFTDEELELITNYDIKYRMGRDADEGGDEADG